jgi:hypothetical protein
MPRDFYINVAAIVGGLSFLAIWLYALLEWGLLLGLCVGWLPAAIGGLLFGALWPLTLIFAFCLFSKK